MGRQTLSGQKRESQRLNARRPRPKEKPAPSDAAGAAVERTKEALRACLPEAAKLVREILENNLRDPTTGEPLHEQRMKPDGSVIGMRVHCPPALRFSVASLLLETVGPPRQSATRPESSEVLAEAGGFSIVIRGLPKPGDTKSEHNGATAPPESREPAAPSSDRAAAAPSTDDRDGAKAETQAAARSPAEQRAAAFLSGQPVPTGRVLAEALQAED